MQYDKYVSRITSYGSTILNQLVLFSVTSLTASAVSIAALELITSAGLNQLGQ